MGTFTVYILKSALCLTAFYLFYKLLLTRDTFHRMNRLMLLVCMVLSCLIPLVHYTVQSPTLVSQPLMNLEDLLMIGSEPVAEQADRPFNWMILVVGTYLLGMLVVIGYHIWSVYQLIRLLRSCQVQRKTSEYRVLTHHMPLAPFSWMKSIIISQEDLEEHGDIYLEHEKAHISLGHFHDMILATLCTIFQWFNPAAWLLKQELENIHEYEADDQVLNRGIDAKTYQILLVKKAAGARLYSLANSFNHSSLKKRITMMLKKKSSVWAYAKYAFVLPVTAVAVAAFARPEVTNLTAPLEAVTMNDLTATVDKGTENLGIDQNVLKDQIPPKKKTQEKTKKEEVIVVGLKDSELKKEDLPDEFPEFPGGAKACMEFIAQNLNYPEEAKAAKAEGRVIVQFVVNEDGSIGEPLIARSIHPALDAEAIRVIKSMPKWTPGKKNGKAISARYTMPVRFSLDGTEVEKTGENTNRVIIRNAPGKGNSIIICNGKVLTKEELNSLDVSTIESITVIKEDASLEEYKQYPGYENGVIVVNTKK
ncbi:MAG: M56 family metallopeptidase [Bacteroidaceae bacterium]|nr:M56 family metallopeptidase [Bacteroidaceae bacterium]